MDLKLGNKPLFLILVYFCHLLGDQNQTFITAVFTNAAADIVVV